MKVMDDPLFVVGVFASMIALLAVRQVLLRFLRTTAEQRAYDQEVSALLTKDEFKVKGRFE